MYCLVLHMVSEHLSRTLKWNISSFSEIDDLSPLIIKAPKSKQNKKYTIWDNTVIINETLWSSVTTYGSAWKQFHFFFFWYVKYIKYSINAIAPVSDIVLLTQNCEEESINVIFPSICLYVHSHLNACVAIFQTLNRTRRNIHDCSVPLQFVQTEVLFKGWGKVWFWFSSHFILE